MASTKEQTDALKVQYAAAKVAAIEAKAAQAALAAEAQRSGALQVAQARAAAAALAAQARAATDAAKAQTAGMAALNRILNDKHVADAKAEALAAKAAKDQAGARLAGEKAAAAQAKAAEQARKGTAAQAQATAKAAETESAHDRILSKKKALLQGLGGEAATLANAVEATGGPLGEMAGKLKSVVSILGQAAEAGPVGMAVVAIAALVGSLVAVSAAAIAAYTAMAHFAVTCADASRSARLFDDAAAGGAVKGGELNRVVSEIAAKVPLARSEIAQFGRSLELAGISGARMQTALEVIASIESVIPGAGAKIQDLVERFQRLKRAQLTKADLAGTGLALVDVAAQLAKMQHISQAAALAMLQNGTASIDAVMEAMKKAVEQKFGKTLAAQMMSLTTQMAKLRENIAGLFADLNLEAVLAGLKTITDLFSQSTVTGRALKFIATVMFQGMLDTVARAAPYIRAFFIGIAIGALTAYLELRKIGATIQELLGDGDKAKGLETALKLGKAAAWVLEQALTAAAGAVVFVISAARMLGAAWDWAKAAVGSVAAVLLAFAELPHQLDTIAAGAASSLIQGLVNGIASGAGAVGAAVAGLAAQIEAGLRDALGWHSPATLGVDAAQAVGQGFEVGADKAGDGATDAAKGMIDAKGVKGAAKGAKAGGKVIYIESLTIGSREDFAAFREMLQGEFEFQGGTT